MLRGHFILAVIAIMVSYISWKIYFKQRAKRKIEICYACDEYSEEKICSGYKTQHLLIREYEEEATEYILSTGYIPKIMK